MTVHHRYKCEDGAPVSPSLKAPGNPWIHIMVGESLSFPWRKAWHSPSWLKWRDRGKPMWFWPQFMGWDSGAQAQDAPSLQLMLSAACPHLRSRIFPLNKTLLLFLSPSPLPSLNLKESHLICRELFLNKNPHQAWPWPLQMEIWCSENWELRVNWHLCFCCWNRAGRFTFLLWASDNGEEN